MNDALLYEQEGAIVTLTLNKPEIRNAIFGYRVSQKSGEVKKKSQSSRMKKPKHTSFRETRYGLYHIDPRNQNNQRRRAEATYMIVVLPEPLGPTDGYKLTKLHFKGDIVKHEVSILRGVCSSPIR